MPTDVALVIFLLIISKSGYAFYSTLGDILHFYSHAALHHPELIKFKEIELQNNSLSLPLVTIANFSTVAPPKPVAVLVFGEHARELITTEVCLWLSKVLLGDHKDFLSWSQTVEAVALAAPVTQEKDLSQWIQEWRSMILSKLTLKVLPLENVDGRVLWEGGDLCRRKTASDVDLNRNWDFAWHAQSRSSEMYGGEAPFSEPQSRYLRDAAGQWKPVAFINVHSGEWAVYTPWDSRESLGAGLLDLDPLVQKMGKICDCMAGPSGAISGYLAYGTSMDYMYARLGVKYPFTIEVYGGGDSGKLKGKRSKPLSTFNITTAAYHRRMLLQPGLNQKHHSSILSLVANSKQVEKGCFQMFNPCDENVYREVISHWVVSLLVMLSTIAAT
ncbi:hypothetical protein CEUSTIGMA_g1396.t1 [Chlamydomonas eustigma]|uniref:Peptidase M14 domain-containing protein n=1 Tax=Chlamydomonas eustigma TaxID=1157962 RepID=A0A250WT69_9CHLO|nr:hypothetical protein CEUSTIGMA_g1396.t1 [Chlamydomonas eustigma]|eukprot:GAX73946.1 hypothetical protein CEUSTIGMA_g1396.t1 [Chlamydomonas eustigma]